MLAKIEAAPVVRAEPPQGGAQPVAPVGAPAQIAELLEGADQAQDRALVEAGAGRAGEAERLPPAPNASRMVSARSTASTRLSAIEIPIAQQRTERHRIPSARTMRLPNIDRSVRRNAILKTEGSGELEMSQLLSGVRVLDLTNVLAGPFACYQLAVLGRRGDQGRGARQRRPRPPARRRRRAQPAAHGRLLPGPERRQAVDHAQPQARRRQGGVPAAGRQRRRRGRELPARRDGPAGPRLRRALKEVKPDLVYCAISGFGQDGPLRGNPAYDQIIQGLSGVMSVTGTPEIAPLRVGYPVCDTIGGITAAFAIAAALVRRERRPARASASTCRCSKPRSSPWAGRSPTG